MNLKKNNPPADPLRGSASPADEIWLDKQDLLTRLHISSRTLQTWRSKGIIPFARIGRKIYYKESDLQRLFIVYMRKP